MVKKKTEISKPTANRIKTNAKGKSKVKAAAKKYSSKNQSSSKAVEFWLVRHGETHMNLERVISHQVKG